MRRYVLIAALIASSEQHVLAQGPADKALEAAVTPAPATTFTLEQALAAAGAASPSLDVAAAELRAAEAGRKVAGMRPNPEVQVQVENVGGTGEFKGTQSAETTTGLALPIELGGKRSARIAVADAQSGRARV